MIIVKNLEVLKRILAGTGEGDPVLSLYIDTDRSKKNFTQIRIDLKNQEKELVRQIADCDSGAQQFFKKAFATAVSQIEAKQEGTPRGWAFFACEQGAFSELHPLPYPVDSCVHLGADPLLVPLVSALSPYQEMLLVIANSRSAQVYASVWGTLSMLWQTESDMGKRGIAQVPSGQEKGKFVRRLEELTQKHIRNLALKVKDLLGKNSAEIVLVSGPREFCTDLASRMREQISLPVELIHGLNEESDHDLLVEVVLREERCLFWEKGEELTGKICEDFSHKGLATAGWRPVLSAAARGAVQQLIVDEPDTRNGVRCPSCSHLGLNEHYCPACKTAMQPQPLLLEALLRQVIGKEGQVMILGRPSVLWDLGGVGARLRFAVS